MAVVKTTIRTQVKQTDMKFMVIEKDSQRRKEACIGDPIMVDLSISKDEFLCQNIYHKSKKEITSLNQSIENSLDSNEKKCLFFMKSRIFMDIMKTLKEFYELDNDSGKENFIAKLISRSLDLIRYNKVRSFQDLAVTLIKEYEFDNFLGSSEQERNELIIGIIERLQDQLTKHHILREIEITEEKNTDEIIILPDNIDYTYQRMLNIRNNNMQEKITEQEELFKPKSKSLSQDNKNEIVSESNEKTSYTKLYPVTCKTKKIESQSIEKNRQIYNKKGKRIGIFSGFSEKMNLIKAKNGSQSEFEASCPDSKNFKDLIVRLFRKKTQKSNNSKPAELNGTTDLSTLIFDKSYSADSSSAVPNAVKRNECEIDFTWAQGLDDQSSTFAYKPFEFTLNYGGENKNLVAENPRNLKKDDEITKSHNFCENTNKKLSVGTVKQLLGPKNHSQQNSNLENTIDIPSILLLDFLNRPQEKKSKDVYKNNKEDENLRKENSFRAVTSKQSNNYPHHDKTIKSNFENDVNNKNNILTPSKFSFESHINFFIFLSIL